MREREAGEGEREKIKKGRTGKNGRNSDTQLQSKTD